MTDEQEIQSAEFQSAVESSTEVSPPQEQFFRAKSSTGINETPSRIQKFKDFVSECKRVLLITKKPDKEELKTIVKISGLGILLIGLLGFLIHLAKEILLK